MSATQGESSQSGGLEEFNGENGGMPLTNVRVNQERMECIGILKHDKEVVTVFLIYLLFWELWLEIPYITRIFTNIELLLTVGKFTLKRKWGARIAMVLQEFVCMCDL